MFRVGLNRRGLAGSLTVAVVGFLLVAGSAVATAGSGWSVQHSRIPKRSWDASLDGISCVSASYCIAVGEANNGASVLVERWDGRNWAIQHTPRLMGADTAHLNGVSCVSPTDCIAVGVAYRGNAGVPLAERWNGRKWMVQPTLNPVYPGQRWRSCSRLSNEPCGELTAISCSGASNCIAVGDSWVLPSLIERWNGRKWTIQHTANGGPWTGVSCPSARFCVAEGSGEAERWNGRKWKLQLMPDPNGHSVWSGGASCVSARDCTAVGFFTWGYKGSSGHTYAERWNGSKWRLQHTSDLGNNALNAISCSSARRCMAVGTGYPDGTLAEHWNGRKWTVQRTPIPEAATYQQDLWFNSVSCPSPHMCIGVGAYRGSSGNLRTLAEHWNGR
jgi:hypothetical protein